MTALRWLAFGDPDAPTWGVAWVPDEAGTGRVALGAGGAWRVVEAELEDSGAAQEWWLRGPGLELALSPSGADAGGTGQGKGVAQPAQARGVITIDGGEHRVDAPAWRAREPELPQPAELDSLRLVTAGFGGEDGLALLAIRPRKARGQEDDRIAVTLRQAGDSRDVVDPRLSTTYGADGTPARAGLELWVSEPAAEPGALAERPHRIAGEAAAEPAAWTQDGLRLEAQPFRWHSHGQDGLGVYLLARPG